MPSIKKSLALLSTTSIMAVPLNRRYSVYSDRAIKHYNVITGNGSYSSSYFSPEKVPYHSVETLIVEAPDYGHESLSETYSFWIWLEAVNGKLTGNYDGVETAWNYLEKHLIPNSKNQPGNSKYNSSSPATYEAEHDEIIEYPSQLIFQNGIVGEDPIAKELQEAYGTWDIYAMHWIIDGDNWYGYGQQGDGTSKPSFINTFRRGPSESTWETVPHPCWEAMKWGGPNGFLDLFTIDNSYTKQWRYITAPDADARAIQATYFAYIWAKEDGIDISSVASKAAKLGDYLRYAQYDKYFKKVGNCIGYNKCSAGKGKNSAHYLISWYFAWGGSLQGDWSWRFGSSHIHSGYQNPLAAWILSTESAFKPKSYSGAADWSQSLTRQLELFRWLQSAEGCIAGGATNSWQGSYADPSSDITTFYGMYYDWQPVYHDPPSNNWTGMQGWGMERVCSLYYLSGDERAGIICRKWAQWVKDTTYVSHGDVKHATNLEWVGNPDKWDSSYFNNSRLNSSLHGTVVSEGVDLGSLASMMKGLLWVSIKDNDQEGLSLFVNVMDAIENYKDKLGYSSLEERVDYAKFGGEVYIPSGWTGKNAQGASIRNGVTFIDLRPKYKKDPNWNQVENFLNGGNLPKFTYHRFWAQTEIMVANGLASILLEQKPKECYYGNKLIADFPCCSYNCEIIYTDDDATWGVENNEWCVCSKDDNIKKPTCSQSILDQGYNCCTTCTEYQYLDDDGYWGVEYDDWCGLPDECVTA